MGVEIERLDIAEVRRQRVTAEEAEAADRRETARLREQEATLIKEEQHSEAEIARLRRKENEALEAKVKRDKAREKGREDLERIKRKIREIQLQENEIKLSLGQLATRKINLILQGDIAYKTGKGKVKSLEKLEANWSRVGANETLEQTLERVGEIQVNYDKYEEVDADGYSFNKATREIIKAEKEAEEIESRISEFQRALIVVPECKEEIDKVEKRLKVLQDQVLAFQEKDNELVAQLKEVKRSRGGMLNEFIAYLQTQVDATYRELTRKDVFITGTASIYVSDKYNPYKGAVTYVPNPPGKRNMWDGAVVFGEAGWNQQ